MLIKNTIEANTFIMLWFMLLMAKCYELFTNAANKKYPIMEPVD